MIWNVKENQKALRALSAVIADDERLTPTARDEMALIFLLHIADERSEQLLGTTVSPNNARHALDHFIPIMSKEELTQRLKSAVSSLKHLMGHLGTDLDEEVNPSTFQGYERRARAVAEKAVDAWLAALNGPARNGRT